MLEKNTPELLKDHDGQAMIEFLLVFTFGLGVTFLFIYMSLNYTIGYINHYATFMASRTLLTADSASNTAEGSWRSARTSAIQTFKKYNLKVFDIKDITTEDVKIHQSIGGSQQTILFVGVTSMFERLISPFKMVGGSEKAKFYSESFLGKEPVRMTCLEQVCQAIGQTSCDTKWKQLDVLLYDNGC